MAYLSGMKSLPSFGVGLGWRPELAADLLRDPACVSLVEVIAETCYTQSKSRKEALALTELWPVLPHGVKLSLGSAEGIDLDRAKRLGALARELRAPAVTEHVSFSRAQGKEIGHLTQLPRTREAIRVLQKNVEALRRCLPDIPLYLENIAWSFTWPDDEMSEGDFYCEVIEQTGCELLLDLSNLYANALNSGQDPRALLRQYPIERVAMIHLAGGVWEDGFYFDTHGHPTPDPVFALLKELFTLRAPVPVVIERDSNYPSFSLLRQELSSAEACFPSEVNPLPPKDLVEDVKTTGVDPGVSASLRTGMTLDGADLSQTQAELADCLTSASPIPEGLLDAFGEKPLQRSRNVLLRKRIDDALPLLDKLGRNPKAAELGVRCVEEPRAPSGVAVVDAFRIATAALLDPALESDARFDRLVLRARFVGPLSDGSMRPRWAPFVGYERTGRTRLWAAKSFGQHAPVKLFF